MHYISNTREHISFDKLKDFYTQLVKQLTSAAMNQETIITASCFFYFNGKDLTFIPKSKGPGHTAKLCVSNLEPFVMV